MPSMLKTAFVVLAIGILAGCATPQGDTKADKQAAVRTMRADTLDKLYAIHPVAREQIGQAEGYAVFSNIGINLFLLSTANGFGVLHDNGGGDTFMRMWSGGVDSAARTPSRVGSGSH